MYRSLGPVNETFLTAPQVGVFDAESDAPRRHLSLVPNEFDDLFDAVEEQWQDRALCAQTDPEAFFPEKGGSTREAKRICSGCEVKAECLEYALANDEGSGSGAASPSASAAASSAASSEPRPASAGHGDHRAVITIGVGHRNRPR